MVEFVMQIMLIIVLDAEQNILQILVSWITKC